MTSGERHFLPAHKVPEGTGSEGFWFVFRDGKLFANGDGGVPTFRPRELAAVEAHYLGTLDGEPCWVIASPVGHIALEHFSWRGLRSFLGTWDPVFFSLAGRAAQLAHWHATHRFCGRCGAATKSVPGERAMDCTGGCGFRLTHGFPHAS